MANICDIFFKKDGKPVLLEKEDGSFTFGTLGLMERGALRDERERADRQSFRWHLTTPLSEDGEFCEGDFATCNDLKYEIIDAYQDDCMATYILEKCPQSE